MVFALSIVCLALIVVGVVIGVVAALRGDREARASGSFDGSTYPGGWSQHTRDRDWLAARRVSARTLVLVGIAVSAVGGMVGVLPGLLGL